MGLLLSSLRMASGTSGFMKKTDSLTGERNWDKTPLKQFGRSKWQTLQNCASPFSRRHGKGGRTAVRPSKLARRARLFRLCFSHPIV